LWRGKICAEKWPNVGIAHQSDEPENRDKKQKFNQSAHEFACLFGFSFFITYIWPFRQYHVIQKIMSEIEQTIADLNNKPVSFSVKKTIVMVGMMGAGKTAVGRALAHRLGVPFLDSDAEIEAAADRTVPEIFERDGEPFFRAKETQVIERLLDEQRCVLSTGGGAFLSELNRANISAKGVSVWLDADLELLWARVRNKDTRPLLRTANPKATLSEIFNQRVPIYAQADLTVGSQDEYSIEDMVDQVIEALSKRSDVLEIKHA
jgi:shikimate kinase